MSCSAAVIDLDGTVYRHRSLVPGADTAVEGLREHGIERLFFSNNPTESPEAYADRLAGMGLSVDPGEILSAATVTAEYVEREHDDDEIFLVGSSGLRDQLAAVDATLTDDHEDPDVVLASFYRGFDYDTMMESLWALEDADDFLGTDPDRTVPIGDGRLVPGSGAIINAVAGVAEREPDRILGKPSETAIAAVTDHLEALPEECLLVGDRLDTDIAMGERAGMTTVLVLTGVTDRDDLADAPVEPDHVVESLADIDDILRTG